MRLHRAHDTKQVQKPRCSESALFGWTMVLAVTTTDTVFEVDEHYSSCRCSGVRSIFSENELQ